MFLHAGAVLDSGWIDETSQFIQRVSDSDRPRAGNNSERQTRISLVLAVIDACEHLADFIGCYQGTFLDRLARPLRARLRRAVGRPFRITGPVSTRVRRATRGAMRLALGPASRCPVRF